MGAHPLAVQYLVDARLAEARRRGADAYRVRRASPPRPLRDLVGAWLVRVGVGVMTPRARPTTPWAASRPARLGP